MENLKVGFSRVNVNPPMGIEISGYYVERFADGILDDLEINAVVVEKSNKRFVIYTLDSCLADTNIFDGFREYIEQKTGISKNAIFIHLTHSHTTPYIRNDNSKIFEVEYFNFLKTRFVDAFNFAVEDLKESKIGIGVSKAENVSFLRRFRMKDGSVATNPGVNNPDIVYPIGEVDERVNVIRFNRVDGENIVIVNFGNHPDVIGGNKISADWCGFVRKYVEKAIENTKCIFINGAQGDVNHVNVFPKGGDMNDMFNDFDGVARGYGHSKYIGRVVTGAVMNVYDKVEYLDNTDINFIEKTVNIPSNMPEKDEIELAHKYNDLHNAGRDDLIPYKGMMLTTVVAESARKVRLENGPEFFPMNIIGLSIGDVAFIGIPGEPFTGVGIGLKDTNEYKMVCPACITNGYQGYFPMKEAYDEGGYETGTSEFKSGVAEQIINYGKEVLKELKKHK